MQPGLPACREKKKIFFFQEHASLENHLVTSSAGLLRAQNQRLTSQHVLTHLTLWFQHPRHSRLRAMWRLQEILRAKTCKGADGMCPPSSAQAASLLRALWDTRGRRSFSSPRALQRKLSFLSISLTAREMWLTNSLSSSHTTGDWMTRKAYLSTCTKMWKRTASSLLNALQKLTALKHEIYTWCILVWFLYMA